MTCVEINHGSDPGQNQWQNSDERRPGVAVSVACGRYAIYVSVLQAHELIAPIYDKKSKGVESLRNPCITPVRKLHPCLPASDWSQAVCLLAAHDFCSPKQSLAEARGASAKRSHSVARQWQGVGTKKLINRSNNTKRALALP